MSLKAQEKKLGSIIFSQNHCEASLRSILPSKKFKKNIMEEIFFNFDFGENPTENADFCSES